MKKKLFIITLFFLSISLSFAQTTFEGFDGLSWKTNVSEFIKKFPSATEETDANDIERNERIFQRNTGSVIRVYRFFDNKLYWGRTVYEDPDLETEKAITEKLIELYGKFDNVDKWTKNNNEYISVLWNISPTFSVEILEKKYYNSYGRSTGKDMYITYENTQIRNEADEYYKEEKKKNIEL